MCSILELNWNQRLGHEKTKLVICDHMLTSSTQLQNRSFHVVERTRTSTECQKIKNARAKRAKILFSLQICKFVGFSFPLSSWLLKLPVVLRRTDGTDLFVRACYTCSTLIFPHSSRPQDPHVLSIILRNRFPLCMEQQGVLASTMGTATTTP